MRVITASELHKCGIDTLGLDSSACDLTFIEAIASALRRAAGFLCPCSHRALIQAVLQSLEGLIEDKAQFQERIENTLEAMIAYGDLLEEFDVSATKYTQQRSSLLYAAPPSFVWRDSGLTFLIGIVPDRVSPLPHHLEQRIEYIGHTRRLSPLSGEDLRTDLKQRGLIELSINRWSKQPSRHESYIDYLRRINSSLAPNRGEIPELKILNPAKTVTCYRGRWENAKDQSGLFIARRPQIYGNDLWCYVELDRGQPVRLLDFPTSDSQLRGCDEAWLLQLAIDASRDNPQRFRVNPMSDNNTRIDFFSPVPMWAHRRWDIVGMPTESHRCLFSYTFPAREALEEINFMQTDLWLAPLS